MKKQRELSELLQDEDFLRWVKSGKRDAVLDRQWQSWMLENPMNREVAEEARLLLLTVVKEQQHKLNEQKQQSIWRKIDSAIENLEPAPKAKNHFLLSYSIAATLLLILAAGVLLMNLPEKIVQKAHVAKIEIESGYKEFRNEESTPHSVLLEDGSTIILQPNSVLRYPEKFTGTKREVFLSGEGFFKITKNPNRPFLVHASELVTHVLGTSFNVRAYEKERHVSVIVKTGKVSVYPELVEENKKTNSGLAAGTFILPNQQIVFSRDERRITKSLVEEPTVLQPNVAAEEFRFADTPISEVFKKLQDTYGITIIYDEEVLRNCMLNASLGDLGFHDKMRVICKGINAQYEILDAHIIISGTGCK